jgi:hypothetical protein
MNTKEQYEETLKQAAQQLEQELGREAGIGAYEHWRYRFTKRDDIVLGWLAVIETNILPRA